MPAAVAHPEPSPDNTPPSQFVSAQRSPQNTMQLTQGYSPAVFLRVHLSAHQVHSSTQNKCDEVATTMNAHLVEC
jgi:hypothetical protein